MVDQDLQLLEQLEAGIVITDAAGIVVRWNSHAERILGRAARDALGRPWTDFMSVVRGDDIAGHEVRVAATQPGGWHGLANLRLGQDRDVWVRAHVQSFKASPGDEKPGIAAIFWPDAGPNASVAEPGPAELPYHDLFRRSPEALLLIDMEGTAADANDAAAELFGLQRDEMIGHSVLSCVEGWSEADTKAAQRELLEAGSIVREMTIQRLDEGQTRVEAIVTMVSPTKDGFALVRLRDLSRVHQREQMLRDLGALARLSDEPMETAEAARQALEIVAEGWRADASIIVLQGPGGFTVVAGPNTSETIRTSFSGLDPAHSPLAHRIREADKPFEINLEGEESPSIWAERVRALGLCALRSTPLWYADERIGAIVLLWSSDPEMAFDGAQLEQIGRFAGLAVGNAGLQGAMRRDATVREALEESARVGGVALAQMAEAIVATDGDRRITALNPAAERMYGLRSEDIIGRPVEQVFEQLKLDGSPFWQETVEAVRTAGYWHGRVIHRPLIGTQTGRHIVVDLSLTAIHDDRRRPVGMIWMSRPVTPSADAESAAVALGSLAAATTRARSKHEVAAAALERLCEAMSADAGVIVTWGESEQIIEASQGLSDDLLDNIRAASIPPLRAALDRPGEIIPLEAIASFVGGAEAAQIVARQGWVTGFMVELRARDQSIGFLALGSRRPAWTRPIDEIVVQVAAQIANALETASLMERLEQGLAQERRMTAQLETLMGLTLLPQGDVSEEAIAQLLLERIIAALGADSGLVALEAADRLRIVASVRMPAAITAPVESQPASSFHFWKRMLADPGGGAFHERVVEAASTEPSLQPLVDNGVISTAVFPIREGNRILGAFSCFFTGSSGAADVDERNVEAVGRIISIAYANVRMREGLAEAAEHERRLTAELRALQELTLLGASTDDLRRLAQETIEGVVVATGASGGGYVLVDPSSAKVDPIIWAGRPSRSWAAFNRSPRMPGDWPPLSQLQSDQGIWLSQPDDSDENAGTARAQAVLPLRVDERLAGVLHLEWADQPRSEQFDVHFLEPIARICSISLANFRLRAELLHRAAAQRALGHRLDALDELTRIGEEASSFEELAHRTASLVREALDASGVCYLLIEVGHHFETHAVAGETGAFRPWLKGAPAKDAPGGSLLLSGAGSVLGDFVASQVNERVLPLAAATGFRSFGAIPIRIGEELAGALLCFFQQPVASLPLDEAALDSVARTTGIALANFRLRERLVASEERYRTLFEETPDALFVSALDGTILDANEAAVRLYQVNRGEVLGRYFGQLVTTDEREMARRRQIVWAQGRGTFHDRGRRPDGSEFPEEVEVRVVELDGQRRFLHLIHDLSDQDQLQRELLQAQKMEALGQLVSGVAHELNNPLAAIIAFSQLMRSDERLPDDMKHDAGLLVQEADRTRHIVQNLLDFARTRPPERRPTSIGTLVQSVLDLQSYALNTNQIQVKVDIPATLPEVNLDRGQLEQVLLNLTINAIQAMRTRDRKTPAQLWIRAALAATRPAAGGAMGEQPADDQQCVRITIRDDGPGVPESARARLFDPFFTTKQPGEGTGLGLSVSFGIVAAHDGHLWYEPGPRGVGSSFVIELPVTARNRETGQPEPRPVEAKPAPGATAPAGATKASPSAAPQPGRASSTHPKRSDSEAKAAAASSEPGWATMPGAGLERASGDKDAPPPPAPWRVGSREPAGASQAKTEAAATSGPAAPATARAVEAAVAGSVGRPSAARSASAPSAGQDDVARPTDPQRDPSPRRPRVLALDDEPSIRTFLRKVLTGAGMDCVPFPDGAEALEGVRETGFDVMLIDHRMAGISGTQFYEAAVQLRPELARRAVFMSGDVLNPDLRGFAIERDIRLLAKPFDIDAVIRVVRETLVAADQ